MRRSLENIFRLGVKELYSLRYDVVLMAFIVWAFSLSIYTAATGMNYELNNAAIALVDEDRSVASQRIAQAFLPPYFAPAELIEFSEIDTSFNNGDYTFVLVIPDGFERDLLSGLRPQIQVNIDATAMTQAGIGDGYIQNIVQREIAAFLDIQPEQIRPEATLTARFVFNQNVNSQWFTGVMQILNSITILSFILAGAALIREREHGTIEHLLVMPVTPFEIMMAKFWANGLVIIVATVFSLTFVVEGLLETPIAGSRLLFCAAVALYLFFISALGIFVATLVRTMPQFGLLFMVVVLPMMLLSGSVTPAESQPELMQTFMKLVPSTHFVAMSQAILYRGAGIEAVWDEFLAVGAVGLAFFAVAAIRFRASIAS